MSLVFVGLLSVISSSGHLKCPVSLCAWLFLAVCWTSYLEKCIRYTDFSLNLSLMPTNQFSSTAHYFVSTMSLGTRTIWNHHNTPSRLEISWTTQMMLAVYIHVKAGLLPHHPYSDLKVRESLSESLPLVGSRLLLSSCQTLKPTQSTVEFQNLFLMDQQMPSGQSSFECWAYLSRVLSSPRFWANNTTLFC